MIGLRMMSEVSGRLLWSDSTIATSSFPTPRLPARGSSRGRAGAGTGSPSILLPVFPLDFWAWREGELAFPVQRQAPPPREPATGVIPASVFNMGGGGTGLLRCAPTCTPAPALAGDPAEPSRTEHPSHFAQEEEPFQYPDYGPPPALEAEPWNIPLAY